MGKLNNKKAVKEIKEKVRKGEKVNLQEIQKKNGYSDSSAKSMKLKLTKTYKKEIKDFIQEMTDERDEALKEAKKKRGKAGYGDLMRAIDTLTKNIQLLSGGATSRDEMTISKEDEKRIKEIFK